MRGMEICPDTQRKFMHATGFGHRASADILASLRRHAEAVILRVTHRDASWRDVAAWPSKQTRHDLPTRLRQSCAVDRDAAADMANGILFDLITEGNA